MNTKSSSGKELDILIDNGIKVIVTDHHELSPDNAPSDRCIAFLNPQKPECNYDKAISGCTVVYLLLLSLADRYNINPLTNKDMLNILGITAITVISDSMKLNSITNRAIVKTGLKVINGFPNCNWDRLLVDEPSIVNYKTLGWRLAPLINSASRMGKARIAYNMFMEIEDKDVREAVSKANELNNDRKIKQNDLFINAKDDYLIDRESKHSIVVKISNGLGIQGIISSIFVNKYKLSTIVFNYDSSTDTYQGSGRSNGNIDIREIFLDIEKKYSDGIIKLGGHKEAAGITIKKDFYDTFKKEFDILAGIQENVNKNFDIEYVDRSMHNVDIELSSLDFSVLNSIELMAPYGKSWDVPLFSTIFLIKRVTKVTRNKQNDMYILELIDSKHTVIETTYFPEMELSFDLKEKTLVNVIYEVNYSNGRSKGLSLNIKDIAEY